MHQVKPAAGSPAPQIFLEFTISCEADGDLADMNAIVPAAAALTDNMQSPKDITQQMASFVQSAPEIVEQVTDVVDNWHVMLDRVKTFVDICDKVAVVRIALY